MKTKQIFNTLKNVKTVITSESVLPILDNFYFKDGTISGTNLENHIIAKTEIKGNFVVDAKNLLRVLSVISDEFSLKAFKDHIVIKSGSMEFNLKLDNKDDYPKIPECNKLIGILTKTDISNIVNASKLTATDELRPALCRVYVSKEKEYCGTDAHCLGWGKIEGNLKLDIFIPKLPILKKLNECEVFTDDAGNIKLKSDNYEVIFRNFDGNYVDYHAILPEKHLKVIKCNKKEFLNLVNAGLSCAHSSTKQGVLETKGDKLILTTDDLDFNNSMKGSIGIKSNEKAECRIGVNLKIFKHLLSFVKEPELEIKTNEPNRAILINDTALIMPVMLNE